MKILLVTAFLFCCILNLPAKGQSATDAKTILSAASKQFRALPNTFSILVPPRIELKCGELNRQQSMQINDYADKFSDPEEAIIKKIMSARKIYEMLKNQAGAEAAIDSASIVLARLGKKALYGLNAYGGDKYYCLPVSVAALQIEKEKNLLTSNSSTEILDLVISKRAEVVQELFRDLKTKHDLSLINTIFYYDKEAHIGREFDPGIFSKLSDALNFTIEIDQQLEYYFDGKLSGTYKANGEAKLKWLFSGNVNNQITGNGKMTLTSCWKSEMCQKEQGSDESPCTSRCDLETYETGDAVLRIDACNNHEINLLFTGFGGPALEHWTRCVDEGGTWLCGSGRLNTQRNREVTKMAQFTGNILVEAGLQPSIADSFTKPDGNYSKFIMPLHDNTIEIGTLQLVKISNDKEWVLTLKFNVMHTPK